MREFLSSLPLLFVARTKKEKAFWIVFECMILALLALMGLSMLLLCGALFYEAFKLTGLVVAATAIGAFWLAVKTVEKYL